METSVAPINHNIGTATVTTAAEAGKAGLRGFSKGGLWTGGIVFALGAGIGLLTGGLGLALGLGALSLIAAVPLGLIGGGVGSIFGATKGTINGVGCVTQEQGAANTMQAQVAVYQAQAQAMAANDSKYNLAAQGSQFNQAGTAVSSYSTDGRVAGAQLQRSA